MEVTANKTYLFSGFELDAECRTLTKDGEKIPLNSKTIDLLLTLIENRGEILSKDRILSAVWAGQFVEENNLTVHISALRKALGERRGEHHFIVTIPGRGYRFVAEVAENQPKNDEILIENHSFSRIVIEEKIENEESTEPHKTEIKNLPAKNEKSRANWFGLNPILAAFLGGMLTLAAIGGAGGYLWQRRAAAFLPVVPFVKSSVKQLTTNGKVSLAALSPDGKLFAYVVSDIGQRSLWLGYVEGGSDIELRPASDVVYSELAFSPDNGFLYFSLRDDKNPHSALYKMPVLGGVAQKILDGVAEFSLAPDGKRIAFGRNDKESGNDLLLVAILDGSGEREIARFDRQKSFYFHTISWSPDGKRLALSAVRDFSIFRTGVLIVEVETGKTEPINNENWREVGKTVWLKNGDLMITAAESGSWSSVPQYRIVHVALENGKMQEITTDRSSYGSSLSVSAESDRLLSVEHRQLNNVWIAPVDDLSQARQITFSPFGKYDGLWGMDWTPDGKLIYTNSDTQSQFISVMNADGSAPKPLTAPGAIDSVLMVSPDGHYIAFHSNRTGDFDIWRTDIDGSNPTQLTFGKKNYQPFISADSRWVYYKCWENGVGELRRVSIDGGEPEILNDKETSWGSFSPDGKFFAAAYRTDKFRLAVFSAETHKPLRQFDFPKNSTASMGTRWTPDGKAIVYRDSNYGYWKQAVDGGEPTRLENLPKEKLYNFAFSKDGKWLAFVRGQEIRDIVLINRNK